MSAQREVKLHVAKQKVRKLRRVGLVCLAGWAIGLGGSVVASSTGHNDLAMEAWCAGEATVLVGYGTLFAGQRRQAEIRRLKAGQEVAGR